MEEENCLDLLMEVVNQACGVNDTDADMGYHLDSMALSTYADALRYLERQGKVEILLQQGKRVIAREKER